MICQNTRSGYITKEEMLEIIGKCPEFSGDKVGTEEKREKNEDGWNDEDEDSDDNVKVGYWPSYLDKNLDGHKFGPGKNIFAVINLKDAI